MIGREVFTVCPKCNRAIKGRIFEKDNKVLLEKTCPDHGVITDMLSSDRKMFNDRMSLLDHPVDNSCNMEKCKMGIFKCKDHIARRSPLAFIEITTRCNMKCPVCYADAEARGRDVPLPDMKRIIDTIRKEDPDTHIILIGGEPTIHEDFFEILAYIREQGMMKRTFIATNAITLADEAFCAKVRDAGVKKFFLAFDGTDREACKKIRGSYISYDALRKALVNIRKNGKAWIILSITAVKDLNLEEIPKAIEFAMENSDIVKRVMISPEVYCGRIDEKEDLTKSRLTGDCIEAYLRKELDVGVATVALSLFFALMRPLKAMRLLPEGSWVESMPSPLCGHLGLLWRKESGEYASIVDFLVKGDAGEVYDLGRKINSYADQIEAKKPSRLLSYCWYFPKYVLMLVSRLDLGNIFGMLGRYIGSGFNIKKFKKDFFGKRMELFYLLGSDKYNFIWDKMPFCLTQHYRIHPDTKEVIKVPGCFVFVFREELEKSGEVGSKA